MEKKTNKLVKYLTPTSIGVALSLAIMYIRGLFEQTELYYIFMYLSDGFFVTGILYVGFGLLLIAANEGVLDIISYGFKSLLYLFTPIRKDPAQGGYYEYKIRQKEKRKGVPYHILVIGGAFLVPAIAFWAAATLNA